MVREAVKFQFSDDFKIAFKRLLKKYRTLKQDLLKVMDEIQESPSEVGVPLFATVRKMRMAISAKGRGKSGGARLILSLYQQEGIVFFLFIYDKNEMENVSDEFIKEILKDMEDAENLRENNPAPQPVPLSWSEIPTVQAHSFQMYIASRSRFWRKLRNMFSCKVIKSTFR